MKKSQAEKENKFKNIFEALCKGRKISGDSSIPVDEDTAALEALRLCRIAPAGKKALLAVPSYGIAEQMMHEFRIWADAAEFPVTAALLPEGSWRDTVTLDSESARAELLEQMTGNRPPDLVIGSVLAFLSPVPDPKEFRSAELILRRGDSFPMSKLTAHLTALGYDDEPQAMAMGEFSRRGWFDDEFENDKEEARKKGPTRIYARFKFFAESWREKRLNVLFDDLDYWDTRIVVGVTGRTNNIYFGSEDSLRWGQDNVKLPEAGYASTRDIFQMPYRLWNKIGDSVHTNDYYAPFREWYQRNQLKMAREVGCVCGGVSHYGASAACANGVPAVTMGEPGHCAFAVRVGKKWRDNNSVSWERSLHWRIWDETDWEFLHLTQEVCGDPEKTIPSFRIATLARLAASEDEKPGTNVVLSLYEYALKKQPLNFPVWREYLQFAAEKKKDDKNFWKDVHKNIVESFLPSFPASGAVTLCKYVYPTLLPLLGSDDEKIALYADFWEKAESQGAGGRWNWEAVWDYQAKTVGEGAGPKTYAFSPKAYNAKTPVAPGNDAAKRAYKEKIGALVASRAKYGEAFEKWKNGTPR